MIEMNTANPQIKKKIRSFRVVILSTPGDRFVFSRSQGDKNTNTRDEPFRGEPYNNNSG
jgi:hypothetical protein